MIPSQYTEQELFTFMKEGCLREVAATLNWTTLAQYQEAINETLLSYGNITTITQATNVRKLRLLARVKVWSSVVQATVADYDFTEGNRTHNRKQIHDNAVMMLQISEAEYQQYLQDSRQTQASQMNFGSVTNKQVW